MISVSFHNGNVSGDLVRAQKAVFDRWGIDHLQIHTNLQHGEAIDEWLHARYWDKVAIFDIDCIPLDPNIMHYAEKAVEDKLLGIAQAANHLTGKVYVGAPFICFSRALWEATGRTSFKETKTEDVAGQFTRVVQAMGHQVEYLLPIHVENPIWKLDHLGMFGHGTTYQKGIYHAFESRYQHESTSRFIMKCNTIINGN